MAATAVEFSNPRNTANGHRRVFIRRFRLVNAITGEIMRREAAGLQRAKLPPGGLSVEPHNQHPIEQRGFGYNLGQCRPINRKEHRGG